MANCRVVGLMGQPTEYVGMMTSRPTVKWWANRLANRVCWSDDQLANCGVGGLMDQLIGYVGVMASWLTVGWVG